jgi:hypothetical protein
LKERYKSGWVTMKGKTQSEESNKKRSKSLKGRKGRTPSLETRLKLSNSLKGNIPWNKGLTKETDERVLKNSIASSETQKGKIDIKNGKTYEEFYGVERAREIKKRSSLAHKGKKQSKETIEKRVKKLKGQKRVFSKEHKENLKKAQQLRRLKSKKEVI